MKKKVKIRFELPHMSDFHFQSLNLVQINFFTRSHTWSLKNYAAKLFAASLNFIVRCNQKRFSNLTSKVIKLCEQI